MYVYIIMYKFMYMYVCICCLHKFSKCIFNIFWLFSVNNFPFFIFMCMYICIFLSISVYLFVCVFSIPARISFTYVHINKYVLENVFKLFSCCLIFFFMYKLAFNIIFIMFYYYFFYYFGYIHTYIIH